MNQHKALSWFVFRHDINTNRIEEYNVFTHGRFAKEIQQALKQEHDYDEFSATLKYIAMYYFWCKCEYEIVITSFPPYIDANEIQRIADTNAAHKNTIIASVSLDCAEKIDIFQQLRMNWKQFVDYVWSFK